MTAKHLAHDVDMPLEPSTGIGQRVDSAPQLLTTREAAAYVRCKSVRAFYAWRQRKHVPVFANGCISRKALDRALAQPRKPRVMAAASLANLRRRKVG